MWPVVRTRLVPATPMLTMVAPQAAAGLVLLLPLTMTTRTEMR